MVTIAKTKQPVRMPRFGHRVDKTDPILRGCVGWWPLNDGAGTKAKDISAYSNDFTNTGGVTWGATDKGTAADFNGTSGTYIRGGTSLLASPSAITVSAWAKLDTYNSSTGHGIVSRWGSGSSGNQFLLYYPAFSNGPRFFVTNSSTNYIAQSSTSSTGFTGRYVHFVGTWDGTDVKLYIDGTEDATTTGPASVNSGNSDYIEIGNYVVNSFCMDGQIQNVRVYDRALTATEVSRLYTEPWAGLKPLSPFSFFSGLSQIYAYYSAAFLQRLG